MKDGRTFSGDRAEIEAKLKPSERREARMEGPGLFGDETTTVIPSWDGEHAAREERIKQRDASQAAPEAPSSDLTKLPPDQIDGAIAKAWDDQTADPEQAHGVVELPKLYSQMKAKYPSLTLDQFHDQLKRMSKEGKLNLMVLNEVRRAKPGMGIKDGDNLLYFAFMKKPKAAEMAKQAPAAAPRQESPKRAEGGNSEFAGQLEAAMKEQEQDIETEDGKVSIPRLYHAMRQQNPKLTSDQFHAELKRMADAGQVVFHEESNPRKMVDPHLALEQGDGKKAYYVERKKGGDQSSQRALHISANPVQHSDAPVKPQNAPHVQQAPPPNGEKIVPPPTPTKEVHSPDPSIVDPKTGVTRASRVGVLPMSVPPPPAAIERLPNLTEAERAAETEFAENYLRNPQAMVDEYRKRQNHVIAHTFKGLNNAQILAAAAEASLKAKEDKGKLKIFGEDDQLKAFAQQNGITAPPSLSYEVGDAPHIFNSDDAKYLSHAWHPPGKSQEEQNKAKALYNTVVHQTASAISKKAFVNHLDEVAKGPDDKKTVLVTSGGCASGKGWSLGSNPRAAEMQRLAGAIWDATGEANGTENPWIVEECRKRGIKMQFAYIHANPEAAFPRMLSRAAQIGRVVDVLPMADSYSIGAKNFQAFHESHRNDPDCEFILFDNSGEAPTEISEVPPESVNVKPEALYAKLSAEMDKAAPTVPPYVADGARNGRRYWMEPQAATEQRKLDIATSPDAQRPKKGEELKEGSRRDLLDYLKGAHPANWLKVAQDIKNRDAWEDYRRSSGMLNMEMLDKLAKTLGK